MKSKCFPALMIVCLLLTQCSKQQDNQSSIPSSPSSPATKKKGSLLFWTNNPAILRNCGVVTIKLGNGQQANITGFYFVAPANCVNQFGGYFLVEEGTYSYQVITSNPACTIAPGYATVVGEQCNMARIQ